MRIDIVYICYIFIVVNVALKINLFPPPLPLKYIFTLKLNVAFVLLYAD